MAELKVNFSNFFQKYAIFILILIFFTAYSALAIGKHQRFETSAADLGIYTQSVWRYSQFEAPFSSIKNFNQLGDHFNPTLALFTPFYWIWKDAKVLLIAQSFFVTLGALPIFWLAKEKLGLAAGLILSFAYLTFPGIQSGIDFNFHPEVMAATWIGFAIYFLFRTEREPKNRRDVNFVYFLLKKQFIWYFVFALLAVGSKEDIAPIFAGLGAYTLIFKRWYLPGFATIFFSLVWFYLTTSIAMPHLLGQPIDFLRFNPKATNVISDLVFRPSNFIKIFIQPFDKVETMITLFGAFSFISATSAFSWFTAPFTFLNRFVSDDWSRWSTHFQYSATIAPLLATSAILGIENLTKLFKKVTVAKIKIFSLIAILAGTIFANRPGWDPPFITPPLTQIAKRSFWTLSENQKLVHQLLKTIPPNVSIATNTNYVPHLINREKIYVFPQVWERPEIYFLTTFNLYPDETLTKFEKEIEKLKKDPEYRLVFEKNGILLFQQISDKI